MPRITPNLWFDQQGLEAAEFYVSVFPNSEIGVVTRYGEGSPMPAGSVLTVNFSLDGQEYTAINGGPIFKFTEAVSFQINCETQKEVDYHWERLSEGGDPGAQQCGWLKDKYGLSWQVVPTVLVRMLTDPDPARSGRVMTAMLQMKKLRIDDLQRAYDG